MPVHDSTRSDRVVIVDLVGGTPASLLPAILRLPFALRLRERGNVVLTRVYPGSPLSTPDLRDLYFDGTSPGEGLDDDVHSAGSGFPPLATERSVFQDMKSHGYHVSMCGAWGMSPSLDADRSRSDWTFDARNSLRAYGIDEYGEEDASVTTRSAACQDDTALESARRIVEGWSSLDRSRDDKRALFVNLLACRDQAKVCATSAGAHRQGPATELVVRTGVSGVVASSRVDLPRTATTHDPRSALACSDLTARMKTGLARAAILTDLRRGHTPHTQTDEQVAGTFDCMMTWAWSTLRRLDQGLCCLLDAADAADARLVVLCHRSLSLMEHRVQVRAPFDACLKGWCLVPRDSIPNSCSTESDLDAPVEAKRLLKAICEHAATGRPMDESCLASGATTLHLAASSLEASGGSPSCDATTMPCFWTRSVVTCANERVYSVVRWWCVGDMVEDKRSPDGAPWKEYLLDATRCEVDAVYDLSMDASEEFNLASDESWRSTEEGVEVEQKGEACTKESLRLRGWKDSSVVVRVPKHHVATRHTRAATADAAPVVQEEARPRTEVVAPPPLPRPSVRASSSSQGIDETRSVTFAQPIVSVSFAAPKETPSVVDIDGRTALDTSLEDNGSMSSERAASAVTSTAPTKGNAKRREGAYLRRAEEWR